MKSLHSRSIGVNYILQCCWVTWPYDMTRKHESEATIRCINTTDLTNVFNNQFIILTYACDCRFPFANENSNFVVRQAKYFSTVIKTENPTHTFEKARFEKHQDHASLLVSNFLDSVTNCLPMPTLYSKIPNFSILFPLETLTIHIHDIKTACWLYRNNQWSKQHIAWLQNHRLADQSGFLTRLTKGTILVFLWPHVHQWQHWEWDMQ